MTNFNKTEDKLPENGVVVETMDVKITDDLTQLNGIRVRIEESDKMNQLQELEEQYKKLGVEIEKLKASTVEAEVWPKNGDEWFSTLSNGTIARNVWGNDDQYDWYYLSTNNCHRTKEAAEAHRAYQMSPRVRARELVELCEGFDVVGCEEIMAEEDKVWVSKHLSLIRYWGSPRFKSGYAQADIDKLGEPLIKVALGLIVGDEAEAIVREAVVKV